VAVQGNKLLLMLGAGYSEYEVSDYHRKYTSFIKEVEKYFSNLHETITTIARTREIDFSVKNDSEVSAKGLRIETSAVGEFCLLPDLESAERFVHLPVPPEAPELPRHLLDRFDRSNLESIPTLQSLHAPRDSTAFYWFDRPTWDSKHSALQCEDFRPTRTYKSSVWINVPGDLPFSGELLLDVSATNLRKPVSVKASISMTEYTAEWSNKEVLSLLPQPVADTIQSVALS
jgi:hypothetical protein